MDGFDFHTFQRKMFMKVFSDPYEKAPTRAEVFGYHVIEKTVKVVKVKEKSRLPGLLKGSLKRKRQEDELNLNLKTAEDPKDFQPTKRIKKSPLSKPKLQRTPKQKLTKLEPDSPQPTPEPQRHSQPLEESDQNVRRSLRNIIKTKRSSFETSKKPEERVITEIKTQDDFMYLLCLERVVKS